MSIFKKNKSSKNTKIQIEELRNDIKFYDHKAMSLEIELEECLLKKRKAEFLLYSLENSDEGTRQPKN